ncbi:uncharacterized protein SPSK_04844 [Sporothrix schenckii 1099-18]|uniref:Uncharacterized protein n=1 Tax=Sporothrix schenckii 1099-18 TaxID=1397361 RepID=A0A0F2LTQ1_SPOSC|nr:uncharacterized protein SPSK_04844 [Sporothrix schenckii 1099-18]KJR80857.1 hypothetical protein SPSK_04844 [Sporothrix schenckii 1099-18]
MAPRSSSPRIITLSDLQGNRGGNASMEDSIRQLTRAIRQNGSEWLPTDTHISYTETGDNNSGDDGGDNGGSKIRGFGRLLGRGSDRVTRSNSARNKSDSSTIAVRGSISRTDPDDIPYHLRSRGPSASMPASGRASSTLRDSSSASARGTARGSRRGSGGAASRRTGSGHSARGRGGADNNDDGTYPVATAEPEEAAEEPETGKGKRDGRAPVQSPPPLHDSVAPHQLPILEEESQGPTSSAVFVPVVVPGIPAAAPPASAAATDRPRDDASAFVEVSSFDLSQLEIRDQSEGGSEIGQHGSEDDDQLNMDIGKLLDDGEVFSDLNDLDEDPYGDDNTRQHRAIKQAFLYLAQKDATSDPQWHTNFAKIEKFINTLLGASEDDAESNSNRYAGVDEGLANALAAAEAALAAEGGSAETLDGRQHVRQQATVDHPSQLLLGGVDSLLRAIRGFNGRDMEPPTPARLLESADDLQSQVQSPPLQDLLQTTGRRFAGQLACHAEAERIVRSEDMQGTHVDVAATGSLDQAPAAQLETHPFTVHMGRYRRFRQHWMQQARQTTEAANSNRRGWATLPPFEGAYSLGRIGDATDSNEDENEDEDEDSSLFTRLPLPVPMERDRRLLVLLRGLGRLLLRRLDIAPRPFLTEVHRYVELGLRGDAPDASLRLRGRFDFEPQSTFSTPRPVRRINETEAQWLQFLLSDSTNEALSAALPRGPHLDEDTSVDPVNAEEVHDKTLDEGSRALYHVFAHRFQALLDDPGRTVFRTADTAVPVTVLMLAINGVPSDPDGRSEATEKTQFCLYDVLHFLARLSRAGRCRFVHYPFEETHGFVQRPLLDVHPEHRIHSTWVTRSQATPASADEAIGAPNRSIDVDVSWAETLSSGHATDSTALPPNVRQFFSALAYRFGRTLRELELVERPRWEPYLRHRRDGRANAMQASIRTWQNTYHSLLHQSGALFEAQADGIPTSFADVLRLADPANFAELEAAHGGVTETQARAVVRSRLIDEAASGQATPLAGWPATATSNASAALWDWAHPSIVGEAPQFFHRDRWPLHLQTTETAARVVDEARIALDPELLWDPASEDPASPQYLWLWSGPSYGYHRMKRVVREYHLGDTELKRQVIARDLTRRVAAAIGMDLDAEREEEENRARGFFGWLGSKLPFGRKRKRNEADDDDNDEGEEDDDGQRTETIDFERTELPAVTGYPQSIDWMALVRARMDAIAAEQADAAEEEADDRDEPEME